MQVKTFCEFVILTYQTIYIHALFRTSAVPFFLKFNWTILLVKINDVNIKLICPIKMTLFHFINPYLNSPKLVATLTNANVYICSGATRIFFLGGGGEGKIGYVIKKR